MISRYEKNIALQPARIAEVLARRAPSGLDRVRRRRAYFVGIGSSYFAARIAEWLWRRHVRAEAYAVSSFDYVRMPQPARRGDAVVLFSHSGAKSYTLEAAAAARRAGALTVGITCVGGPWREGLDLRLETCEREDTGAFTKSLTTALAWVARMTGSLRLLSDFKKAASSLRGGPPFPRAGERSDVILVGDTVREWVAREIALKLQEAATLPARAFGLEEFLHGPRVSAGPRSLVIGLTSAEPRWGAVRDFLATVGVPFVEAEGEGFGDAGWLRQLYWGQRWAVPLCRRLGVDPDALRTDDSRYKKARERLKL